MKKKPVMLIVDDVEANREMIRSLFADEFHVLTACNGIETIEIIENRGGAVSVILLDIIMPKMDGIQVLEWITESKYSNIPVIAITSDPSYQLKALNKGAWDFISKPADNSVIKARVHNVLGRYDLEKEKKLTATLKFYDNLVNESNSAIYVSDINSYELLHMNTTCIKMLKKNYEPYEGRKCYEYLFGRNSPCEFCSIGSMKEEEFLERDYTYPLNKKIYCMRGKLTDWNGVAAHVEYIQDVTEERKNFKELSEAQNKVVELQKNAEKTLQSYAMLINTVPGAIALYEVVNNRVLTKYYSDGLCRLSGYSREERDYYNKDDAMTLIYEEDAPYVMQEIKSAIKAEKGLDLTYRIKTKSGKPHFVNLRAAYLRGENGNPEFHAVFTDVDELKRLEEVTREQQLRYELAIKSSGINIWEYNIINNSLNVVSNSPRIKQNCFVIEDYIDSTIRNGYVREDSINDFYNIFKRLKSGEQDVTADIWYKTTDEAGFWCERISYTTVFDDNGKPIKAFGAGRDVTREKEAEEKFLEEATYREVMQNKNLSSIKLNLTTNQVVSGESDFKVVSELTKNCTADAYFAKTAEYIVSNENKTSFLNDYNRKSLISKFTSGEFSMHMNIARKFDEDRMFWVKYSVHLMRHPQTKDIIAYVVSSDITHEKVMQTIMETVAKTDYEFFVVVDGVSNSAVDYAVTDKERLFSEDQPFEARNEMLVRSRVCKQDADMVVENCKIDNVIKHTQNGEVYKFNFSMYEHSGEIRRKQMQITLINNDRKTFLMTRIDVNNIYIEQQQAQQKLEVALDAARHASKVKTEFLSRMSHDMRTPMNGILGLLNLTLDDENLPDSVKNNLNGIYDSSKYLLSLINDTLDMSKIESDKIKLNLQTVNISGLIDNVVSYVVTLAKEKEIALKLRADYGGIKHIKADALRLQQIFVNIISNSIKFTEKGGQVDFIIDCTKKQGDIVYNKIIVRDNGIGMSKEFLPRIFEPFEQEQKEVMSNYSGTGLGMSIVKNLVEMMNGTIKVNSEQGVGTEIVIVIPFECVYNYEPEETAAAADMDALINRRVLLCEDHPLNAQIAIKLLEKKGLIVEHAENGEIAINMFSASAENYYDFILMDIRMPIIDGLEAARQIRSLKRGDSKTVPIIAMTANAFNEDMEKSKASGMNAHLAKPIEPRELFVTLLGLLPKK